MFNSRDEFKKIHLLWLVTFVTGFELFSTGNQWCINSESL